MATASHKRPLDSITNTRLNAFTSSTSTASHPAKKPRLTQLTLDLGQKVHTKCKFCGMNYILSSDEDRRLHKKYHDGVVTESVQGIALTKAAGEMGRVVTSCAPRSGKMGRGLAVKEERTGAKRLFSSVAGNETRSEEIKGDASDAPYGISRTQRTPEQGINTHDQDHILEIRRSDPRPLKTLARRVLEAAETALGAVPVEEKQLWSEVRAEDAEAQVGATSSSSTKAGLTRPPSQRGRKQRQKRAAGQGTTATTTTEVRGAQNVDDHGGLKTRLHDRYRVYLYIHAQKCVGLLLAERIHSARVVLAPKPPSANPPVPSRQADSASTSALPTPPPSSPSPADEQHTSTPLMASTATVPARMGISRIWVLPTFRGKGIAARMLEGAMGAFAEGESATTSQGGEGEAKGPEGKEQVEGLKGYKKEEVAFSQPTEMGRKLAERWWGAAGGWLVYD